MKKDTEYAVQVKRGGKYIDLDTFNAHNCLWKTPQKDWLNQIKECYVWKKACNRKSARIVMRTITENIVYHSWEGGAK